MKVFSSIRIISILFLMISTMLVAGVDDGLVAHWEFEGTLDDTSSNSNHGTAYNGAGYAAGRFGQGLELDGINDYVRVPNSTTFQFGGGSFSISVWIKPDSGTDNARVVDVRGQGASGVKGWMLKIGENNGDWQIDQAGVDDSNSLIACYGCGSDYSYDGWHHIVMIYNDDSNIQFYINGIPDSSTSTGTLSDFDNSLPLAIGASVASNGTVGTASQFFGGIIDDLRIYDRALTPTDIRNLNGNEIMADVTLNVPSDYSTIQDAVDSLQFKRIGSGSIVTIQVADGTYTYDSEIVVNHVDGERIAILGNTASPSLCTIDFTDDANGFVVKNNRTLGHLDGFTLDGDNGAGIGVYALRSGQILMGDNMDITDFHTGVMADYSSTIEAQNITANGNGTFGIYASNSSSIDCTGATANNNTNSNIVAIHNSTVDATNATANGAAKGLNAWTGSTIISSGATIQNNTDGLFCNDGSHIYMGGGTVSGNTTNYNPTANAVGNNNSYIRKY